MLHSSIFFSSKCNLNAIFECIHDMLIKGFLEFYIELLYVLYNPNSKGSKWAIKNLTCRYPKLVCSKQNKNKKLHLMKIWHLLSFLF